MKRIRCTTREDWLAKRDDYIGGSDAAAILGCSPWKSAAELFDEKTGRVQPKDISKSPAVAYGIAMEPCLRRSASIDLPYFEWDYHPYDLLISDERPFMAATLDGEVTVARKNPWDLPIGTRGIFEAKTGSFRREEDLIEWEAYIPEHYLVQTVHQLSVTGWDFVIVSARLKRDGYRTDDNGFPEIRQYYRIVDRRSVWILERMAKLEEAESAFWRDKEQGIRPTRIIG